MSNAQQTSAKNSNDCPLAHWSTTGAACQWAPDLTPGEEAHLKSGVPVRSASQMEPLNRMPWTAPPPRILIPDSAWMPMLPESIFKKMVPTLPDSLLWRMIRLLPDSVVKESVPDLSLIHISEPTRQAEISYAVFCLK